MNNTFVTVLPMRAGWWLRDSYIAIVSTTTIIMSVVVVVMGKDGLLYYAVDIHLSSVVPYPWAVDIDRESMPRGLVVRPTVAACSPPAPNVAAHQAHP